MRNEIDTTAHDAARARSRCWETKCVSKRNADHVADPSWYGT